MAERILVVDGEPDSGNAAADHLKSDGFDVVFASDGASAQREIARRLPDLVLLDLLLPDVSGVALLRKIRSSPETRTLPLIVLSTRGEELDRVLAFELGADDYVQKPFSKRELVLRIRAVLRRSGSVEQVATSDRLAVGPLELDVERHHLLVDGSPVPLTALEFRLLVDLASRRGLVQTRESILARVWRSAEGVETRTVDTHVKRLRRKLGRAGRWIETVRGVGYRLRDPSI